MPLGAFIFVDFTHDLTDQPIIPRRDPARLQRAELPQPDAEPVGVLAVLFGIVVPVGITVDDEGAF